MASGFSTALRHICGMHRDFLLTTLLALSVTLVAIPAKAAPSVLSSVAGNKRIVLLFSTSKSDSQLDRQIGRFAERRYALEERDMIVLMTAGNRETIAAIGYASLRSGTAIELRRHYEPATRGMTAILVGKDGEEKGRWQGVVDPQTLFDLVDSMPMRQEETGTGNNGLTN